MAIVDGVPTRAHERRFLGNQLLSRMSVRQGSFTCSFKLARQSVSIRAVIALLLFALLPGLAQAPITLPLAYDCHFTKKPPNIDGKLNDAVWDQASWTSDFVDIEGAAKPTPRFRTRVKMLWDQQNLYIAAQLEEPDVKATLTQHDSVIFEDNDFEVFIKPLPETDSYYEFEMNALNTGWDLFLVKPYSVGGRPDNSWDIPNLRTVVSVQGTLNNSADKDQGWTLEIVYPLNAFQARQNVPVPVPGTQWRLNFSRVEWKAGQPKEDNWVWAPQGVINMHVPDRWGYLNFVR